ncbi:MAG TPA: tetratricopeptide repeat protein [Stellaceae bacterium]|nr:tetratricopeptide repeat protein [Stellaceae bacterium]
MSDIFREIDEELRRDNFLKLWQRHGKYLIALAAALVVATALYVGWRQYQLRQSQAEGVRFAAALDLAHQGKGKEAADAFAAMAQGSSAGRAVLARLEEAAAKAKDGDRNGAIAIYDEITSDSSAGPIYRNVATLLAARFQVDTDPKAAIEQLKPLTDADNAWHSSALELTAIAQLKEGDNTAARATYQKIADDLTAPQGARARAAEMVTALSQ